MSWSSAWDLPAVSTITHVSPRFFPFNRPSSETRRASTLIPRWNTLAPAWLPSISSCSIAAGRCTSAATRVMVCSSDLSNCAIFADVVVFPEPLSPTIKITPVEEEGEFSGTLSPPSTLINSPLVAFITSWEVVKAPLCCSCDVLTLISFTRERATLKLTSASSKALLISFNAASTSNSDRRPLFPSMLKILVNRSDNLSNISDTPTKFAS